MRAREARGTGQEGTGCRLAVLLAVLLALGAVPVHAQSSALDVVDALRQQRRDARVAEVTAEVGPRVEPRPLALVGETDPHTAALLEVREREAARLDSLRRADEARADRAIREARLAVARWRKVEPGEQGSFLEQYREAFWQAIPAGRAPTLDTTATPELRGRLQAAFGDPTRNADAQRRYGYGGSEFVQFEYWFVVNDSIPILALDVDGPFGRGLVLAGDAAQAHFLPALRTQLSQRLAAVRSDPYVDYYRNYDRQAWYRTGYNGAELFTVPVRPPRWAGQSGDRWIIHR